MPALPARRCGTRSRCVVRGRSPRRPRHAAAPRGRQGARRCARSRHAASAPGGQGATRTGDSGNPRRTGRRFPRPTPNGRRSGRSWPVHTAPRTGAARRWRVGARRCRSPSRPCAVHGRWRRARTGRAHAPSARGGRRCVRGIRRHRPAYARRYEPRAGRGASRCRRDAPVPATASRPGARGPAPGRGRRSRVHVASRTSRRWRGSSPRSLPRTRPPRGQNVRATAPAMPESPPNGAAGVAAKPTGPTRR